MKCEQCGNETRVLLTVRNWKGDMKRVCRPCYYGIKEYS